MRHNMDTNTIIYICMIGLFKHNIYILGLFLCCDRLNYQIWAPMLVCFLTEFKNINTNIKYIVFDSNTVSTLKKKIQASTSYE